MPKSYVVAARDAAMQAFGRPAFAPSVGTAMRSFADEVNRADAENGFHKHPEDYELHLLAEFDDETGCFSAPEGGPRCLVRGKDVVSR